MFDNFFYLFDKLVIENNYWTYSSYKTVSWTLITSFYKELIDSLTLFKMGWRWRWGRGVEGAKMPPDQFFLCNFYKR